jgi:hypothetical protein
MTTQTFLFDEPRTPTFTNRATKAVTFKGKMDLPIHRWYRLTPSFSPQLADDIANHFKLGKDDLVLDPFAGVGTVPLCMKYRGIPACSIELNPYLHFVGTIKTRNYDDVGAIEKCIASFMRTFEAAAAKLPRESNAAKYLADNADYVPRIHKVERWWTPANLMQLVCLRRMLLNFKADPIHYDLLRMGVLGILIPVSNAKHNHVSLTFAEHPLHTVNIVCVIGEQYRKMIEDLRAVSGLPRSEVTIYSGNSKEASSVLPKSQKVTAVITSPPYPNRFSYARETRPHLFFFDFIKDAGCVGEMETDAIGGTWGKATSVLINGVKPANKIVADLLQSHLAPVRDGGALMASYVTKYFNDIYTHAGEVAKVCAKHAQLAYVVGNSKFFENPLASDEILASIFAHFGFTLHRIDRMRRRQSKSGLYEAVVFMRR